MSNFQRKQEILNILKEKKYVTVDYLAEHVHISTSSIRRDLTFLEKEGILKRSHGGASLITAEPGMAPFSLRLHENKKEKSAISKAAAKLIKANSTIYIDSSTIALSIYQFLNPELNVTVFTNNIYLAQLLTSRQIRTYCVGGYVSGQNSVITIGPYALDMLKTIYVDMMFFSSSALSENGIISDVNEEETALRRLMITHSKERVFLCYSKRFGSTSHFAAATMEELNYIISDKMFPPDFIQTYSNTKFITIQ